jgi:hypothetical protein
LTPTGCASAWPSKNKPWTWHLLNWRIAAKEFAISGAEHNPRIRDKQFALFLKETLLGNHRLVKPDAARKPALSGGRHPGRAGREDERADRLAPH